MSNTVRRFLWFFFTPISPFLKKVQQLQGSMRDIIQCMSVLCKLPNNPMDSAVGTDSQKTDVKDSSGTQTEIVAVHTPQVENLPFPFANKLARPSTLSLVDSGDNAVKSRNISEKDGDENADGDQKSELDSASTSKKDETPEKLNRKMEENQESSSLTIVQIENQESSSLTIMHENDSRNYVFWPGSAENPH